MIEVSVAQLKSGDVVVCNNLIQIVLSVLHSSTDLTVGGVNINFNQVNVWWLCVSTREEIVCKTRYWSEHNMLSADYFLQS